jgi:hypothetical protein
VQEFDEDPGWSPAAQDAAEAADVELTPPDRDRRRWRTSPIPLLILFGALFLVFFIGFIVLLFTASDSDFVP